MHTKKKHHGKRIRGIFAGMAVIMALILVLSSVPVAALYAEQTGGDPQAGESAGMEEREKSVTSPNSEKPQEESEELEESEESAGEKETGSEAETVSANVLTAAYGLRAAAADKSGGLEFRWQTDLPKVETEYSAGEGTILWTPELEGNNVVSGTLTLQNAMIDANEMGIWVCVPVTVVLEGENRILAGKTNTNASGIYLSGSGGSVITGSGSLEIQSGGGGIKSAGGITIDGAEISIAYGSGDNGIWTSYADMVIRNGSQVKVTGSGNSGAMQIQNICDIVIENSKVIVINNAGEAINTSGNIRLTSSDARAVGNTSKNYVSGTLAVGYDKHIIMDGGTLYVENTGNDIEFPYVKDNAEMKNGAVLYTNQTYILYLQGSGVCYSGCTYDQSTDEITVIGTGNAVGNVIWNENMCIPEGKTLRVGRYYDAVLTVPEGTVVDIPEKSTLDIYSYGGKQGALINNGTINIPDGASLYNMYDKTTQTGGTIENNGMIQVSDAGILQNRSNLTNSGSIQSTGNFSNVRLTDYYGSINNTGTIDGFVIEMLDDAYINKANGDTVIKNGQTLTLGAGADSTGTKDRTLRILEGATLTVEEGAVIDAKTKVKKDTLSQYLDIGDALVLNGVLLLPADTDPDIVQGLAEYIEGTGSIRLGDGADQSDYYIAQVTGSAAGSTGKGLYKKGTAVVIDAGSRDDYRFTGWTAAPDSVVIADASAVQTTFTMPAGSVTLTANWEQITYGVTVNSSKAAVTGAGVYAAGAVVSVDAGTWEGYVFKGWSSENGVAFKDPAQAATTFVMPRHPVTVTASWEEKPEETTPSPEETTPSPEETTPSPEETTPSPEETTSSSGGAGSSSGNQSSSSGTHGKQKNPQPAAKPEETLPIAETNETQNQGVSALTAGADTGDASGIGWYLLLGILSLSGCLAVICHSAKKPAADSKSL